MPYNVNLMGSLSIKLVENSIKDIKMGNTEKQRPKNGKLPINSVSVSDFKSFIEWKDKQNKDYLGGKLIYDIKGYYKRLDETELLDYWLERVHSR